MLATLWGTEWDVRTLVRPSPRHEAAWVTALRMGAGTVPPFCGLSSVVRMTKSRVARGICKRIMANIDWRAGGRRSWPSGTCGRRGDGGDGACPGAAQPPAAAPAARFIRASSASCK